MDEEAGATAMDVRDGPETVSDAVPLIAPEVAVMVIGPPAATPVARPALVMEAVPVAEDVHVTLLVRFCVELSV
jgi:hypothetical protein